jgi:xanthine dehydrogenase YagR molybdenum-binding subunit
VVHYHQAIAVVVADSFEQARAAAALIRTDYARSPGQFDLAAAADAAPLVPGGNGQPAIHRVGNFDSAFAAAPVTIDRSYTTPDESHAMMEPHATIAAWEGEKLTVWTSNQMIAWGKGSLAKTLGIKPENVRLDSPFIGGGFGGKLFIRADVVLAALAAKAAQRPVKIALPRPFMMNNTTHRPATIQRVKLGATRDGRLTAISHSSISGNLAEGKPESAVQQTQLLYAAPIARPS